MAGTVLNDYFYAAGMRLGRRDSAGRVYTYFNDPLGSPRYIQGPGSTQAEFDYYPAVYPERSRRGGERVISNTLASANNYKFTSMERDTESGLDHTLYRQFTSTYGRWLTPDPDCFGCTNPQKLNRYAYVLNNPVTLTDPLGLDEVVCGPDLQNCTMSITTSIPTPGDPAPYDGPGSGLWDLVFWGGWGNSFVPLLDGSGGGDGGGSNADKHPCDESYPKNKTYLDFIRAHQADATKLAKQSGTTVDEILGLSAEESKFGAARFAQQGNNFFGLHAPAPGETGEMQSTGDGLMATFGSFLASGQSFLTEKQSYIQGVTDPGTFATDLHQHGFGVGNGRYVDDLTNVIGNVKQRLDCPQLKSP